MHAARLGAGTAAVIAVLGLSGCAFNPLSTFTTPTIDQIEYETVTPAVSDDALVTPGTLTVALDTSDAPQAMQGADGDPKDVVQFLRQEHQFQSRDQC